MHVVVGCDFKVQGSGIRDQGSEIRDQGSEIGDQGSNDFQLRRLAGCRLTDLWLTDLYSLIILFIPFDLFIFLLYLFKKVFHLIYIIQRIINIKFQLGHAAQLVPYS